MMKIKADEIKQKLDEIKQRLEEALPAGRFIHSINVMKVSGELAKIHNADINKAMAAGLLHDCARGMSDEELIDFCESNGISIDNISRRQPVLLHGAAGVLIAQQKYGITDEGILKAILTHTMGKANMDKLQKIVFVADFIEDDRDFEGIEDIRAASRDNLDLAAFMCCDASIRYILKKGRLIHQDTVDTRNQLLEKQIAQNIFFGV